MTDVAAGPDPARPDEPSAGPSRADEPRTDPARPDEPSAGPPCVDAPRTDPSGPDERWSDLTPPPGSPRHARPVRWLAATLTLGVLALLAVALTGAVAPQVRPAVSSGPAWAGGGRVEVEVRNEAVTGTRLVDAGEEAPGLDLVGVEVTTPDGARAELGPDGVVIPGGGRATVVLAYEVTDCEVAALASSRPVPVTFRTPLGLTRTLDVRHEGVWADSMAESSCPQGPPSR